MNLLPEDVGDILSLLDTLPFDEVDLETADLRVAFRRVEGSGWTQESQILREPNVVQAQSVEADGTAMPATTEPGSAREGERQRAGGWGADGRDGLLEVRAPLPGTFYRAPKPGAPPYVEVGSRVEEDTVVGLIETMKLFNAIHANARGTVVEFLLNDAELAQKNGPLLLIEPDEDFASRETRAGASAEPRPGNFAGPGPTKHAEEPRAEPRPGN
jgi:acetyl-CoA carboxylase biotin carboxyl carrier protein